MADISSKKLVKSKSGLRIVAINDTFRSPFELIEPEWVPDKNSPDCSVCHIKFDFVTRRHHCRRCGQIYCKSCCDAKVFLHRMCFVDPVRLCENCAEVTKKENEFYEKHLKILLNGASFHVVSALVENESNCVFICKLSSDQKYILFDSAQNNIRHIPVDISKILSSGYSPNDERKGAGSLEIEFLDTMKEKQLLRLTTPDETDIKPSCHWIHAFQRAFKMLFESQGAITN